LASLAKQSKKIHSAFSSLAEGKFRLGEQIVSDEAEVREASKQFYAALNRMANGDAGPLADIWSHGAAVTTMHPIGGRQVGWDKIRGSFGRVAKLASEGKVKLANQIIHVAGDMAYELGVERGQLKLAGQKVSISDRVTNVYRREAGAWKIVHHHTDIAQAMIDVLSRLKKKKKKK
jgi:ketosteroid isomerase-like protein